MVKHLSYARFTGQIFLDLTNQHVSDGHATYKPLWTDSNQGGGGVGGGVTTSLRWLPATAGQIFVTRCHEEKH